MLVTDLDTVVAAAAELDPAVATFQKNFGFPVVRRDADGKTRSVALGIGAAEIEIVSPSGDGSPLAAFLAERGPGLYLLVLAVDDLEAASSELGARGFDISTTKTTDGRPMVLLSPAQTHGARIGLVAAK